MLCLLCAITVRSGWWRVVSLTRNPVWVSVLVLVVVLHGVSQVLWLRHSAHLLQKLRERKERNICHTLHTATSQRTL